MNSCISVHFYFMLSLDFSELENMAYRPGPLKDTVVHFEYAGVHAA